MSLILAQVWNLGTCRLDRRERFKRRSRKSLSTDARHRDGATRMSDEGSVMGLEQRGCVIWSYSWANPRGEEPDG